MLTNINGALERYRKGIYDDIKKWNRVDAIRLCHLLLRTYDPSKDQDGRPWRSIWTTCAQAIQRYHETEGWRGGKESEKKPDYWEVDIQPSSEEQLLEDDQTLARECLKIVESDFETLVQPEVRHEDEVKIPQELIAALRLFVPGEISDGDEGILEEQEDES